MHSEPEQHTGIQRCFLASSANSGSSDWVTLHQSRGSSLLLEALGTTSKYFWISSSISDLCLFSVDNPDDVMNPGDVRDPPKNSRENFSASFRMSSSYNEM